MRRRRLTKTARNPIGKGQRFLEGALRGGAGGFADAMEMKYILPQMMQLLQGQNPAGLLTQGMSTEEAAAKQSECMSRNQAGGPQYTWNPATQTCEQQATGADENADVNRASMPPWTEPFQGGGTGSA